MLRSCGWIALPLCIIRSGKVQYSILSSDYITTLEGNAVTYYECIWHQQEYN